VCVEALGQDTGLFIMFSSCSPSGRVDEMSMQNLNVFIFVRLHISVPYTYFLPVYLIIYLYTCISSCVHHLHFEFSCHVPALSPESSRGVP